MHNFNGMTTTVNRLAMVYDFSGIINPRMTALFAGAAQKNEVYNGILTTAIYRPQQGVEPDGQRCGDRNVVW